jgi:hypothetical protein
MGHSAHSGHGLPGPCPGIVFIMSLDFPLLVDRLDDSQLESLCCKVIINTKVDVSALFTRITLLVSIQIQYGERAGLQQR